MTNCETATARRIIIIDDNQAIHRDFETILLESADTGAGNELEEFLFGGDGCRQTAANRYELGFASQGQEGVRMIQHALAEGRPYMLAFVDMRMPPGWDGLETIEHIWELDPDVQVVICSAYCDYSWGQMTDKLGMRDNLLILEKPFDINEVSQLAAALTEKWLMTKRALANTANLERMVKEKTAQALTEKDRLQKYLDVAGVMLLCFGRDLKVRMVNREGCEVLGCKQPEIIGRDWCTDFVPEEAREEVRVVLAELTQGKLDRFEHYENPVITQSNGIRQIAWHNAVMTDENGNVEGILSSGEDITERKKVEQAAKMAYSRLQEANKELKSMQSQIIQSEKLASIGQLAAGVAHEMNNPVGFVASNFETLEGYVARLESLMLMHENLLKEVKNLGSDKLRNKAEMIEQTRKNMKMDFVLADIQQLVKDSREGLARITGIIRNLRDFSRIDQPDAVAEFDINTGINATLIVVRNETKYHCNVNLELGDVPKILGNAGQVNQVLLNILVNASHAIKSQERSENGNITVRTFAEDKCVVCEISDDGPGIPQEIISKIFDPFFTTKPVGKGTGLGLSVSHDIVVNKHKGQLLVDSTVGKGTKFTIRLPIGSEEKTDLQ